MGESAQDIWNRSLEQMAEVVTFLGDEKNSDPTPEERDAGLKLMIEAATKAHYGFGELAAAGQHIELTRALEAATKDLLEGLLNGDAPQVMRGREAALSIARSLAQQQEVDR